MVIYLKLVFSEENSYQRESIESNSIKIKKEKDSNMYEIEKIIAKHKIYIERDRQQKVHSKFQIKWFK